MYKDLKANIENWLDTQFNRRRESIVDGSCKDIADYTRRCGYLEALRDIGDVLKEWEEKTTDDLTKGDF